MVATLISPPIQPRWVGEGSLRIYTASSDIDLPDLPVTAAFVFAMSPQGTAMKKVVSRGWDLPGGHLEPSEAPRDAAVRELFEEAGLTVPAAELDIVGFFHVFNPPASQYPPESLLAFYRAQLKESPPLAASLECEAARWMAGPEFAAVSLQHLWLRLVPRD